LQWWFVLGVIIIAWGIYWYFRWRINDINQKNQLIADKLKLEQEVKQSMLASIKSQMNPHFCSMHSIPFRRIFIPTTKKMLLCIWVNSVN
jgi:hypothetical protein